MRLADLVNALVQLGNIELEGARAFKAKRLLTANPYGEADDDQRIAHGAWRNGWLNARKAERSS